MRMINHRQHGDFSSQLVMASSEWLPDLRPTLFPPPIYRLPSTLPPLHEFTSHASRPTIPVPDYSRPRILVL